jgi:hypothetical protein
MSDPVVKITTRIPTRKSFDGQPAAVGRTEGLPMISLESDALPSKPAAIRLSGQPWGWFVPADPAEAFRLNQLWRDAR